MVKGYFNEVYVAIPVVVDLLLRHDRRRRAMAPTPRRNPCCSGPTASTAMKKREFLELMGRNPCCSGPTASTVRSEEWARYLEQGRNPCCSGPTASTWPKKGQWSYWPRRNPCCSGPTASTELKKDDQIVFKVVAIPVVVDLLLRLIGHLLMKKLRRGRNPCCSGPTASTENGCNSPLRVRESQSLL